MFDFFRKPYKILFIIILAMLIGSIFTTKPLPDLTNGELTESIPSNNGKYILNKYVVYTDSLSSDFIRIEVENTNTNQKRNVYYAEIFDFMQKKCIMRRSSPRAQGAALRTRKGRVP